MQIVLNESLITAPKLTERQLAVLAVIFLFKYTQNFGVGNHDLFGQYVDKYVAPFVPKLGKNIATYQHLQFSGCGAIGIGSKKLEDLLGTVYQGQFLKGFDEKEIADRQISIGMNPKFFIQCLNASSKIQVRANSKEMLDKVLEENYISDEDCQKIRTLFDLGKMSDLEIKNKCIEIRPYMTELFDVWSDSAMKNFTLTSVGVAIGHANIKRLVGEFADLSIWIN